MDIQAKTFLRMTAATCSSCLWLLLVASGLHAQTYDFGYVPLGSTNKASGFNFAGTNYNGTNLFMASESIVGLNAADFLVSTNYAGQFLPPSAFYFYSLSFVPHSLGFETAALSTFETPSPPFGAGITYLQGVGAPTNRPGSGPIVPELAPLEQAMTNFLATRQFSAGTLAVMKDSNWFFARVMAGVIPISAGSSIPTIYSASPA